MPAIAISVGLALVVLLNTGRTGESDGPSLAKKIEPTEIDQPAGFTVEPAPSDSTAKVRRTAKGLPEGFIVELAPSDSTVRMSRTVDRAAAKEREILDQAKDRLGDPDLLQLYREINERHFGARLPTIPVNWEPRLAEVPPPAPGFKLLGITNGRMILLNSALRDDPRTSRATLCHEMVHVALRTGRSKHGPDFQRELRRLLDEGAFEGLWASEDEKSTLRSWLDSESTRLNAEDSSLDTARDEIRREENDRDREVDALNARVAAANATGTGWPPDQEIQRARARDEALSQRVGEFNVRVARKNADSQHFNSEVARYNLMMSYPDGLDEESLVQPRSMSGSVKGGR